MLSGVSLLTTTAYHISTLLAVSRITKDQGDHALSSELLERALFSFGRAATSSFNTKLSKGQARLDFARPENREFWLAGYHYIKSLIQKGTYRTAFEWAKLLLSLDPEGDPYKMGLVLHELALRAGENKWLIELSECNIGIMWQQEEGGFYNAACHTMPSFVLAAMNLKEGVKAREDLWHYMQTLPWVFVRLFSELNLKAPPSIWGILPRNATETLFTELYVLQTKDMWNTIEATALLMEVAHSLSKVDPRKVREMDHLTHSSMGINVVRFVYLEGNQTIMALAPSNLLHRDSADWDPYPPEANIFSYESQRTALNRAQGRLDARVVIDGIAYDPLAAVLHMLPGRDDTESDDSSDMPELEDIEEYPANRAINAPRGLISRALALMGWDGASVETGEEELDQNLVRAAMSDNDERGENDVGGEPTHASSSQTPSHIAEDGESAETSGHGRQGDENTRESIDAPRYQVPLGADEEREFLEDLENRLRPYLDTLPSWT